MQGISIHLLYRMSEMRNETTPAQWSPLHYLQVHAWFLERWELMEPSVSSMTRIAPKTINHLCFIHVSVSEHSVEFTEMELEKMETEALSLARLCRNIIRNRR